MSAMTSVCTCCTSLIPLWSLLSLPPIQLAITLRNVSLVFSDLGQPNRSVHLLERALDINTNIYGSDAITVAVTLSNLSVAHRHLGNVQTSHNLASQALEKMEALRGASPGMMILVIANNKVVYFVHLHV